MSSFVTETRILKEIADCEDEVARVAEEPKLLEEVLNKLQKLQDEAISKGAYSLDSKVEKIMEATGFSSEDSGNLVSSFSGGWKMRIALAKILLQDP